MDNTDGEKLFVGRISHACAVVRPENLQKAMDLMGRALQIEFEGPFFREDTGNLAGVAAKAGIEIIAPGTPDHRLHQHIEQYGEGWYVIGFGVSDQDGSCQRMKDMGHEPLGRVVRTGLEGWADDYKRLEVTMFDPSVFGGLRMVLSTFEQ